MSDSHPPGVLMGCGVTARDENEAMRILKEQVFRNHAFPAIRSVARDVKIAELDAGHVRPNMGDPSAPGVWFPLGYT